MRRLVYIADGALGEIFTYSYGRRKLEGEITGLNSPEGECVQKDKVWVANTGASQLLEYAFGGMTPTATIGDSGKLPIDCAVDPTTGNVAAMNIITSSFGNGSVSIWTSPSSKPMNYAVAGLPSPYFGSYDNRGDLFVDGMQTVSSGGFGFAELSKGSRKFKMLSISGATMGFPRGVQWDGDSLVLCDQLGPSGHAVCYQLNVSGTVATVTGTTQLDGAFDAVQVFIKHGKLIAPDPSKPNVQFYTYPTGGSPAKTITGDFFEPLGTAVINRK